MKTIEWEKNAIKIIDQTKLPLELEYLYLKDLQSLWKAIKTMKVRGAPALGAAAGLGVFLGLKDSRAKSYLQFAKELKRVVHYIGSSRPTARNLFWALERIYAVAVRNKNKPVADIKRLIFEDARKIIREDMRSCRRLARYGAKLVDDHDTILTVCNAGILATIDYGTALGVLYRAREEGKKIKVFACETRPMLQGARLTTWELARKGVGVTLICDNTAAALMKEGKINKVVTGADRIAANGDAANKIGTYNLAVLSSYHKIPFYIAAPASTVDVNTKTGSDIEIEQRPGSEVTELFFKTPIAAKRYKSF